MHPKRFLVSVLTLACSFAPIANASAAEPLTLEAAVKQALARNERAKKAPLRVEVAEGQRERARAAFLPSLGASETGTLRPVPDRNGRILGAGGTVTLSQPLLNASAFPSYAQANHTLEAEKWNATDDRRAVAFDAARAFLQTLTTERVLETARRRLERARAFQADATARAQAQLASSNDVTRAEVATATSEQQRVQAEANVVRAYLQLGFLLGGPIAGPLTAPERTTRAAAQGAFKADALAQFALGRRPDVHAAGEKTASLRASASEPYYRLIPTLGLSAQLRTTIAPVAPDTWHDESLQATLSWQIFDAGVRYADRRSRLAQADSQALDENLLRRSVAVELNIALNSLGASRDIFRISEDAVRSAQRNTDETDALYRQGLARAIELVDANASRYDAEVNRANAKLSMEQAYLDVRFALGLDPTGEELESLGLGLGPAEAQGADRR